MSRKAQTGILIQPLFKSQVLAFYKTLDGEELVAENKGLWGSIDNHCLFIIREDDIPLLVAIECDIKEVKSE